MRNSSYPEFIARAVASVVLVGGLSVFVRPIWSLYETGVRPTARVVPTFTPTPVPDLERARAEGRRTRQILDYLGAANAYREAGQRDWAIERYRDVLKLDPGNLDARTGLRDLGVSVATTVSINTPVPTVAPLAPTNTPTRR